MNPNHADVYSFLGALYLSNNDIEKAIKQFKLAIDNNPNLIKVYGFISLAYAMQGDFEKADKFLLQAKLKGYKNYEMIENKIELLR
ncbi:tetratricopeptide repeat protein [Abyssisolibacter fermentans]|uniref:tetratricopeptide repeat protein n=1 Tax=Abyssisolibacter fermentans TaxID=1766203 RepID=UPI00082F0057|nr:tetratricopeptide repeat protein [Abyssisolibacter fermentans]